MRLANRAAGGLAAAVFGLCAAAALIASMQRATWIKGGSSRREENPTARRARRPPSAAAEIQEVLLCGTAAAHGPGQRFFCDQSWSPPTGHLAGVAIPLAARQSIWRVARRHMEAAFIASVVASASVKGGTVAGVEVGIWAPTVDAGVTTALAEQGRNDYGAGFDLGPDDLFVDVGSNLGIVTIRAALKQPAGRFLAVEAASPTWLMQQMSLLTNLPASTVARVHSVCAGLSGKAGSMTMTYRPWSTTSTRNWSTDKKDGDVDVTVQLKTLTTLYREAGIDPRTHIKILKLDCEGCEYAVVPAFTDEEFALVDDVVGEIHWGYIPPLHQPSRDVADATHRRMCQYKNLADIALECCLYEAPGLPSPKNRALCASNPQWLTKLQNTGTVEELRLLRADR